MANSDMCLEAAQKVYPNNEDLRVAYMLGFNDGFDKAKEQIEVDFEDIEYLILNKLRYLPGYWIKTNPSCAEIIRDFNNRLNAKRKK